MSYESTGAAALGGPTCRYGISRLLVRGPRRDLDGPYLAFLGGAETFGRFVEAPFPALVEEALGRVCVNLGCVNAGLDAFIHDPETMRVAQGAQMVVIQLPGAQNMSNRFYRVHPRRNDRFLAASQILTAIYPEVDFTEFHFTRHMLGALRAVSEDRFALVRSELEQAWLARMRLKIRAIGRPVCLLWLRYRESMDSVLGPDPLFVADEAVNVLRRDAAELVTVEVTGAGLAGELGDMSARAASAPAAAHLVGPATHRDIAACLAAVLERHL